VRALAIHGSLCRGLLDAFLCRHLKK
jgi:hypothetical protein